MKTLLDIQIVRFLLEECAPGDVFNINDCFT